MDSNWLWSPAFINYGISSGILYMTHYVFIMYGLKNILH